MYKELNIEEFPVKSIKKQSALSGTIRSNNTISAIDTDYILLTAGMKKKKGQLVVNGDVDVPTVHYENLENVMIPVNVEDGDDVVWAIAAIAITPDDEKLVKAVGK